MPWLAALAVGVGAGLLLSSPAFLTRFSDPLAPLQGAVGLEALGPGRFHGSFQRPAASSLPDLDDRLAALRGKAGTRGVLDLLEDLPEAVRSLEDQARSQPDSATAWSDLAAAYLTRGAGSPANEDPLDILAALRAAQTATRLDPEHPEAAFNFAESLTRCGLKHEALQAWNHYLDLDPASAWTSLALDCRKRLGSPTHDRRWNDQGKPALLAALAAGDREGVRGVVDRFRTRSREFVLKELFPAWAKAYLVNDPAQYEAVRSQLVQLTNLLAQISGDPLLAHTAKHLDRSPGIHREIAGLIATWKESGEFAELDARAAALEKLESPLAGWARYWAERVRYNHDPQRSREELTQLITWASARHYSMVHSSALALLGLIDAKEDRPELALERYRVARSLANAAEGPISELPFHLVEASAAQRLGHLRQAWRARFTGALSAAEVGDKTRIHGPILTAVEALLDSGEVTLARLFLDELVANARGSERVDVRTETLLQAGRLAAMQERWTDAEELFASAIADADAHGGHLGSRLRAVVQLAQGRTLAQRNPEQADRLLSEALDYFRSGNFPFYEAATLDARAKSQAQADRFEEAAKTYQDSIDAWTRRRNKLSDSNSQLFTLEQGRSTFDAKIRLELVSLRSAERAFFTAEDAKARRLTEHLGLVDSGPTDLQGLREEIPVGVMLIAYTVLNEGIGIWLIHRHSDLFRWVPVPRGHLDLAIAELHSALRRNEDIDATTRKLSQWIWYPIATEIPKESRVIVIPDGALADVPWGLVHGPKSSRPLVNDHQISLAPNVRIALAALREPWRRPESVLVMADPATDEFHGLDRLPEAAREGAEVAALYSARPESGYFSGEGATSEIFLDSGPRFELVHFAGHGIGQADSPADSALFFAPSESFPDGKLSAARIAEVDWPETRVVILASCQGVQNGAVGREVLAGLSAAFLAGGVKTLIASPERVPEYATAALMNALHRALLAGQSPAAALRTAQLELIRSPDESLNQPKHWATWLVIGSP
ncbi:MAG: CHAT domain-containing protein [Thermoanaerobaculia bacterium]|nr:CHAT domain-containing protein [Thermoanaerobaculia bacterium]